jgi:hypothetical protein
MITRKRKHLLRSLAIARSQRHRKVQCIETGIIYDTIKAAADANKITPTYLRAICNGHKESWEGKTYRFYDQNNNHQ